MFDKFLPEFPAGSACATHPLRSALVLGCATLALVGCGGGSSDAPPPPTLTAPTNFTVEFGSREYFLWTATPGATRYELHVDPDGAGPQPETKIRDYNQADGTGFSYTSGNSQYFSGSVAGTDLSPTGRLNASYRLRACDASGCGAFTAPQALDIAKGVSHEFPSGRAPLMSSAGNNSSYASLSQDGLTLALNTYTASTQALYVFVRSATGQPWQQQAVLPISPTRIVLSADGGTLVVSGFGNSDAPVHVYQRTNGAWSLQTTIESTQTPSACAQPCQVIADNTALSADGNLLAVTGRSGPASYGTNAVFTYIRTGTGWAPQAYLAPGASEVGTTIALSGDGRTLALNGGAFTRSANTTPPYMHIYAQNGEGVWSEQARMPVGIVKFLDIAASRNSAASLSSDGNTLAVEAQNLPGNQPAEFDIDVGDLTCGSKEPWSTTPMPTGSYSTAPGWHIALFARDGTTWRRQAVMARDTQSWALANDGNALFYGNALFTRDNGTWACP